MYSPGPALSWAYSFLISVEVMDALYWSQLQKATTAGWPHQLPTLSVHPVSETLSLVPMPLASPSVVITYAAQRSSSLFSVCLFDLLLSFLHNPYLF